MESSSSKEEVVSLPEPKRAAKEDVVSLPEPKRAAKEAVVSPPEPKRIVKQEEVSLPKPRRAQRRNEWATQVVFRSFATMATFAAALVIIFDEQTTDIAGFAMHASYKSSPTYRFFMIGNFVATGYEMLALIVVSYTGTHFLVNFMDLMAMSLVMASAAAATAIGHVGKKGNSHTGWMPVCNYFEKFCNRVEYSVACSYVGFLCLLVVCSLIAIPKSRTSSN
ncbi:CASP-like protein 1F2 [Elaeis guineensis]|uniref:CASP-like protein n=1 Tax=Elaeis guineensis var. tenera TaxID=51953 RepID=A0A6I9RFP6_ELAGV|nr:CASP-like protein 1F2 [Elaeis guineensis]